MNEPLQESRWEVVTSAESLRREGLEEHMIGSTLILLAWVGDRPWAGAGLCTHQFARLANGRIAGGRLHCPQHKASFCLRTGSPDEGWAIPALRLYPVRVGSDGVVEVDLNGRL